MESRKSGFLRKPSSLPIFFTSSTDWSDPVGAVLRLLFMLRDFGGNTQRVSIGIFCSSMKKGLEILASLQSYLLFSAPVISFE